LHRDGSSLRVIEAKNLQNVVEFCSISLNFAQFRTLEQNAKSSAFWYRSESESAKLI